jgi:hypothetical protein
LTGSTALARVATAARVGGDLDRDTGTDVAPFIYLAGHVTFTAVRRVVTKDRVQGNTHSRDADLRSITGISLGTTVARIEANNGLGAFSAEA